MISKGNNMNKSHESNNNSHHNSNKIMKEVLIGLLAIVLGGYNLLTFFGVITVFVDIPRIVGNVILLFSGFLLLITAIKLYRHKYYSNKLF